MYGDIPAMRTSKGTWPEGSQWTRCVRHVHMAQIALVL